MIRKIRIDKRALLLKEVLNMVIAVLCLIILFTLGFNLYGMFLKKTALEQAQGSLNDIANKISQLNETKISTNYLVTAPKDWFIIAYKGNVPNSCASNNCLCICPKEDIEACYKDGACKDIGLIFYSSQSIQIKKIFELQLIKEGDSLKLNQI